MARLLIVSDSHGEVIKLEDLLRKYKGQYDLLVHLGDRVYDMLSVQEPVGKSILVQGNMEMDVPVQVPDAVHEAVFDVEGVKILATHGHRYSVNNTFVFLKKEALKRGVKLVLFGHTHEKVLTVEDGIMFFNPGALKNNDFGMITIENGDIVNIEQGFLPDK